MLLRSASISIAYLLQYELLWGSAYATLRAEEKILVVSNYEKSVQSYGQLYHIELTICFWNEVFDEDLHKLAFNSAYFSIIVPDGE